MKKILIIIGCFFLVGCADEKTVTTIQKENQKISINYPVTNVNTLDDAISSYINKTYKSFKEYYKDYKEPELNISYTYKEVNNDVINVSLNTEIVADRQVNKIKTFTYNKKSKKFLTMEDIVDDFAALDYDLKKQLAEKYQSVDIDYLENLSYDYFTIDDDNLTVYFNQTEIKSPKENLIYLDIPLTSLTLLIDIDKSKDSDVYINLKKRDINEDSKVVALTFDDGPSKYTDKYLDVLKKNDAVGTFFVIGNNVKAYDKILIKMLKNGNEIGNHSYSHKWLNRLSQEEFEDEINKTQDIIKKTTGFTPLIFRPTYGGYSDKLKKYTGLTFILWDVDSLDWKVKSKDKIVKNVIQNVKNSSIVLMHDNHIYSLSALDEIIKYLKEQGYEFVTISELLELKELREEQ